MSLELQFKIKNDPNLARYLREHSYWYKILNRDPSSIAQFEEEVKDAYKLRTSDKINHVLDTLEVLQTLMSTMR